MKAILKNNLREIKNSLGRYIAIGAITMLGVGFFSGLTITEDAMMDTADDYIQRSEMYDYKVISTLGLREGDIEALSDADGVVSAEGVFSADFIGDFEGDEFVFAGSTLSQNINIPEVKYGRLPAAENEIAVDSLRFFEDDLGKKIGIADINDEETKEYFTQDEYTIVGIVTSPLYIDRIRPTSKLGGGSISAFVLFGDGGMECDYFTEAYVKLEGNEYIHSDEYEDKIDLRLGEFEDLAQELADGYYDSEYGKALSEINDAEGEYSDGAAELEEAKDKVATAVEELAKARQDYADGVLAIDEAKAELEGKKAELEAGFDEYNTSLEQYNMMIAASYPVPAGTKEQLDAVLAELTRGQAELDAADDEIARREAELADAEAEFAEAEAEIADARSEIAENEVKLADARAEIDDARAELEDFEKPDTYVLTREANVSYVNVKNNSSIVSGVARVFPLFFFAVAALVCSTTMARMVSDGRTQIGTLKALGYSGGQIMMKYIFYSGSSAVLGCLIGFFAGSWLFPMAIWQAYKMLYVFADRLNVVFSPVLCVLSMAASLLCSVGVTYVTVKKEARDTPASLIRPQAPVSGKKILLEKIDFIWKRFRFIHKVSLRNIFRYKKRLFMMVLGIGGCTALVLTGFGVDDSISDIVTMQYDEIMRYDVALTLTDGADDEYKAKFDRETADAVESRAFVSLVTADIFTDSGIKSVELAACSDDSLEKLVDLHTSKGGHVDYPVGNRVVLSEKLARLGGFEVGDEVEIHLSETETLVCVLSGTCENYVNYVGFVSSEAYEYSSLPLPEEKTVYLTVKDGLDVHESAAGLLSLDNTVRVSVIEDLKAMVDDMMESLGGIVFLVILSAAALALVVLYNLTNINITERVREIATLKVLGFYPMEVSNYVFRENIVLTLMGTIIGLPAGCLLHSFVMSQINVDMVSFRTQILPMSYVYSAVLTMAFTFAVNLFMNIKLKRINMAESLKSVE